MERVEYPSRGDFLECEVCNTRAILVEPGSNERRKRLLDFLEEHLATCYQRRSEKK